MYSNGKIEGLQICHSSVEIMNERNARVSMKNHLNEMNSIEEP